MTFMLRYLALPLMLLAPGVAAADTDINHGGQLWGSFQVTAPLGDNWSASVDVQPRWSTDNAATAPITIIPPVISYRASENLIVSGGYLYAYIDGARISGFHESRFFQSFSYRLATLGKLGIRGQTRFEQRQRSLGKDWNARVAQTILFALPLTKNNSAGPVGIASAELYWNLNETDWGARRGYDDLWRFVGVQVPIATDAAVEFGYLNQRQRAVNGRANMNHAAVIGFSLQLSPRVRPPKVVPTLGPAAVPPTAAPTSPAPATGM